MIHDLLNSALMMLLGSIAGCIAAFYLGQRLGRSSRDFSAMIIKRSRKWRRQHQRNCHSERSSQTSPTSKSAADAVS